MNSSEFLTDDERKIYRSLIPVFFSLNVDANSAAENFDNPNICANIKAAAAFVEAALSLIEIQNDFRRSHNGKSINAENTCDAPPTSQT